MTMQVYVLVPEDQRTVIQPHDIWGASKVTVVNRDWYGARARAIEHALGRGYTAIGVLCNSIELYYRPHWNGSGPETGLHRACENHTHGMWLYLDRLVKRFGHVYVPSVKAVRSWGSLRKYPWEYSCAPTIPMVAAYQTAALQSLDDLNGPLGRGLCANGYDSLTVSDYFYHNLGELVLDEPGSATTWRASYERAINRIL